MKNESIKPLQISIYAGFIFLTVFLTAQTKAFSSDLISSDGLTALRLVNKIRVENNLNELTWNDKLAKAAELKADDMVQNKYFEHTSPQGLKAWDFINKQDYSYFTAGENLAIDYSSVEKATLAWENSQSHMANIVGKSYKEFGFATIENDKGSKIYVQIFASPKPLYETVLTNLVEGKGD